MTDIVVKRFRWSYYEYGATRAKIMIFRDFLT